MKPRYNLCPSQDGIIVRLNAEGEFFASTARWGFLPAWAVKTKPEGWSIARGETVAQLNAFKSAFKRNRCLVLVNGFYEWDPKVKPKQPYYIHRRDDAMFAIAGIWASLPKEDGTEDLSYAMITIGPNEVMAPIHHRMPVILEEKDYRTWLNPKTETETLLELIRPCPDDILEAYPVSMFVNKTSNDSPDCIRRLQG